MNRRASSEWLVLQVTGFDENPAFFDVRPMTTLNWPDRSRQLVEKGWTYGCSLSFGRLAMIGGLGRERFCLHFSQRVIARLINRLKICESKWSSSANMFHFVKGSSQPKGLKPELKRVHVDWNKILANVNTGKQIPSGSNERARAESNSRFVCTIGIGLTRRWYLSDVQSQPSPMTYSVGSASTCKSRIGVALSFSGILSKTFLEEDANAVKLNPPVDREAKESWENRTASSSFSNDLDMSE